MEAGTHDEHHRVRSVYDDLLRDAAGRWDLQNPGNAAIFEERLRSFAEIVAHRPLPPEARLLDFGSGASTALGPALDTPARFGLDILLDRLLTAGSNGVPLVCGDGQALPFTSESFDVIASVVVLSSVVDDVVRRRIAAELTRVLRPGGYVLWYDMRYRNPQNRNLRPLGRRTIEALFPELDVEVGTITVLPPLARRLGGWTDRVYPVAGALPPLRSHLVGTLTKPAR